eukprot:500230-Pyramimonas_sp.AAC.2
MHLAHPGRDAEQTPSLAPALLTGDLLASLASGPLALSALSPLSPSEELLSAPSSSARHAKDTKASIALELPPDSSPSRPHRERPLRPAATHAARGAVV